MGEREIEENVSELPSPARLSTPNPLKAFHLGELYVQWGKHSIAGTNVPTGTFERFQPAFR
jgi:hypothetical protein